MILEIDLSPDMAEQLRAKANQKGISGRDYVRSLVFADLSEEPPQQEALHNAMDFAGVGKEALRGVDVDAFVRGMRDEWADHS